MKDLKVIKRLLTGILLVLIGVPFLTVGSSGNNGLLILGFVLFAVGIIVFIFGLSTKPQE